MHEMRIPKRNGKFRTVVIPTKAERAALQEIVPDLAAAAMVLDVHNVQHGFTPGRSPVTCARAHIGFRFTVSFDLADCFDNVHAEHVQEYFSGGHATADVRKRIGGRTIFHDNKAAQGLPTSPALCNLALSKLDSEIVAKLAARGVYTRYADDLTISTNDLAVVNEFLADLPAMTQAHGQTVNPDKTHVQDARGGRRIIVGIAVSATGIHPTRKNKRRLRAARHQRNKKQARGLAEWNSLKAPDLIRKIKQLIGTDVVAAHVQARMILQRSGL
jgi:hypothetical protein